MCCLSFILISYQFATCQLPFFLFLSRTGIEMYMKSSKKNGVQGSSPSLSWTDSIFQPFQSISIHFQKISKTRVDSHISTFCFLLPRHHSMLHDIVHKEKAARGAIEDRASTTKHHNCESLEPENPNDIWRSHTFEAFWKRLLISRMHVFFCFCFRSYWLRRKWSEVNIMHLLKSERYTQCFPATSILTAAISLSPTRFNISLVIWFFDIFSSVGITCASDLRSSLFRRHWAYLTAWYGRTEPMLKLWRWNWDCLENDMPSDFQEIEERSKEYRRLWDAIDTHTHDLSTQVPWKNCGFKTCHDMILGLLMFFLFATDLVESYWISLKWVHLCSPWFELWKVLAHKKHQETICGTEVVSCCLDVFSLHLLEFCADYWWNQRICPRDHRKLLRFAQTPKASQGKEAKSMSVGHLKRWESRVFSKHWWILDDLKWTTAPLAPTHRHTYHIIYMMMQRSSSWILAKWCSQSQVSDPAGYRRYPTITSVSLLSVGRDWNGSNLDGWIDWLIDSFIHACMHSFIHSFIPSFLHSFIPSFLHSFNSVPASTNQGATSHHMDTNSTATAACLSGASGDPYIWWYLLYIAHRLERQLELQRRSMKVLEINWSTQPPLVFPAEWSEVVTMTNAPQTPPVRQFPSMVGLFVGCEEALCSYNVEWLCHKM